VSSAVFAQAVALWRACRVEYGDYLESAYALAEHETNGALLNARGRAKGVDAFSLFSGTEVRALAYASEELVQHWQRHPRITYTSFEKQWVQQSTEGD
jgi:hypothetical protein